MPPIFFKCDTCLKNGYLRCYPAPVAGSQHGLFWHFCQFLGWPETSTLLLDLWLGTAGTRELSLAAPLVLLTIEDGTMSDSLWSSPRSFLMRAEYELFDFNDICSLRVIRKLNTAANNHRRVLLLLPVALLLLSLLGCGKEQVRAEAPPPEVEVTPVKQEDVPLY